MFRPLFPRFFLDDPTLGGGGTPPDPPPTPPTPEIRRRGNVCEFCECRLTGDGEIINMGEKAKRMRKSQEEIEKLEGIIATLRQEKEDLQRKVTELTPTTTETHASKGLRIKGV
jgi:hypothetical protein